MSELYSDRFEKFGAMIAEQVDNPRLWQKNITMLLDAFREATDEEAEIYGRMLTIGLEEAIEQKP